MSISKNKTILNIMRKEFNSDSGAYVNDGCFNMTAMAEWYLADHDLEDDEEAFEVAFTLCEELVKSGAVVE